jgi:hypothetical protein
VAVHDEEETVVQLLKRMMMPLLTTAPVCIIALAGGVVRPPGSDDGDAYTGTPMGEIIFGDIHRLDGHVKAWWDQDGVA